jgi:uncharacterized protein (TIGR02145 family)
MFDITSIATGSRFRFSDKYQDPRDSPCYVEITQTVAEIITAYDVPTDTTITLSIFRNNDITKPTTSTTVPVNAIIYADRCNSDPTGKSWVYFEEGTFKIREGMALVDMSLEELLTGSSLLKDYDGNGYTTVTIGTQEWIVETLKVEHYSDGTVIPNITDSALWVADTTGAFSYYENDIANKSNIGILYNWYAVDNVHGLAYFERGGIQEVGWRVPTYADFQALATLIGGVDQAGDLKEVGFVHWNPPNFGATDLYGFKAISGGNRFIDTALNDGFSGFRVYGDYWTSTESIDPNAYSGWLTAANGTAEWGNFGKLTGQNVRCVRDV